jgi:hypothetical protein
MRSLRLSRPAVPTESLPFHSQTRLESSVALFSFSAGVISTSGLINSRSLSLDSLRPYLTDTGSSASYPDAGDGTPAETTHVPDTPSLTRGPGT